MTIASGHTHLCLRSYIISRSAGWDQEERLVWQAHLRQSERPLLSLREVLKG